MHLAASHLRLVVPGAIAMRPTVDPLLVPGALVRWPGGSPLCVNLVVDIGLAHKVRVLQIHPTWLTGSVIERR